MKVPRNNKNIKVVRKKERSLVKEHTLGNLSFPPLKEESTSDRKDQTTINLRQS